MMQLGWLAHVMVLLFYCFTAIPTAALLHTTAAHAPPSKRVTPLLTGWQFITGATGYCQAGWMNWPAAEGANPTLCQSVSPGEEPLLPTLYLKQIGTVSTSPPAGTNQQQHPGVFSMR